MKLGGPASPDFERRFNEAVADYRRAANPETAVRMRNLAFEFYRARPGLASIGPYLGLMDGVEEKTPKQHRRFFFRLHLAAFRLMLLAWRPGWNDYYMMRWQVTRGEAALLEMHARAFHIPTPDELRRCSQRDLQRKHAVWSSAQWMVNSYRLQDPEFNAAMSAVESACLKCVRPELLGRGTSPSSVGYLE
jgi:hypothetical protein